MTKKIIRTAAVQPGVSKETKEENLDVVHEQTEFLKSEQTRIEQH